MKLLGHASPDMTMVYLDIVMTDLQREFDLALSQPRHAAPPPLPDGSSRGSLDRFVNRLTKILSEVRKLRLTGTMGASGVISTNTRFCPALLKLTTRVVLVHAAAPRKKR